MRQVDANTFVFSWVIPVEVVPNPRPRPLVPQPSRQLPLPLRFKVIRRLPTSLLQGLVAQPPPLRQQHPPVARLRLPQRHPPRP